MMTLDDVACNSPRNPKNYHHRCNRYVRRTTDYGSFLLKRESEMGIVLKAHAHFPEMTIRTGDISCSLPELKPYCRSTPGFSTLHDDLVGNRSNNYTGNT